MFDPMNSRPLINRITQQAQNDFGASTSFPTFSIRPPAIETPPRSLADKMLESPQGPVTLSTAMATISAELSNQLGVGDEAAREIFLQWTELREQLTKFLSGRTDAYREKLRATIADLTQAGRACLDRIRELTNEKGQAQSFWNTLEQRASELRAVLIGYTGSDPNGSAENIDDSFVLPHEIEQWTNSVAAARAAVDAKHAEMRPIESNIASLTEKIEAERKMLQTIREERRCLRLELVDGVKRVPGLGLGGMPGRSAF